RVVEAICGLRAEGQNVAEIAKELRVSIHLVEAVLNLVRGLKSSGITDSLIQAVASGAIDIDEALAQTDPDSKATARALRSAGQQQWTKTRVKGQKQSSRSFRLGGDQ